MQPTLQEAFALDAQDPLAHLRAHFVLPPRTIYLDGNSLGALPRTTIGHVARVIEREWGDGLIRSWQDANWIGASERIGAKIAPLIGAHPEEVVVADSTSVNLYKLLAATMAAHPRYRTIVTEAGNFPTDLYIADGLAAIWPGANVVSVARGQVIAAANEQTIVLLTHVHYKTGERFDLLSVTRAVQERGAIVLWDLSHSTGAVELDLNGANADLAVGCGYKYLNGGPGAPAFLYVARRHQARLRSPLAGWLGHAAPFAFSDVYEPADGITRFQCGTPPVLALAALESGIDLFLQTSMPLLAKKSETLCNLFMKTVEARCSASELQLLTPRRASARGSHVSFAHPQGRLVMQTLTARGILGDFREPDVMRFGFAPLYNTHEEAWRAACALEEAIADACNKVAAD